jgi:hypothetical protein
MDDQVRPVVTANLTVANRTYPMKVPDFDETYYRRAESLIMDEMSYLSKDYNDRDVQDKLAVILLNLTAYLLKSEAHLTDFENIDRELGFYLEQKGSLDNIE